MSNAIKRILIQTATGEKYTEVVKATNAFIVDGVDESEEGYIIIKQEDGTFKLTEAIFKSLELNGSLVINKTKTAISDYVVLDDDEYTDIDFTTGLINRICTLPTLEDNIGRILWISKVDDTIGKVIVTCEGSDTFLDNSNEIDLESIGDTLVVKASTNGWKVF